MLYQVFNRFVNRTLNIDMFFTPQFFLSCSLSIGFESFLQAGAQAVLGILPEIRSQTGLYPLFRKEPNLHIPLQKVVSVRYIPSGVGWKGTCWGFKDTWLTSIKARWIITLSETQIICEREISCCFSCNHALEETTHFFSWIRTTMFMKGTESKE